MPAAERPGGRHVGAGNGAGKANGSPRPPSSQRAARRRAVAARRNRVLLAGAAAVSGVVLVAWFPGSELLHQRHQLDAAAAQLRQLDHENHALARRAEQLQTPAEVARIAEQQYDLVPPGQQAYQVLPKSGSGGSPALTTAPAPGAATGPRGAAARSSGATPAAPKTFFGRVLKTLEFWQ